VKTLPYYVSLARVVCYGVVYTTHLLLVGEEELVRVDAISDGAADDGKQVEDDRWLVGVLEQQLLQNVENNGEQNKGGEAGGNQDREGRVGGKIAQWTGNLGEDTHIVLMLNRGLQRRCAVLLRGCLLIDIFLWS
jgi:hypothetical protein